MKTPFSTYLESIAPVVKEVIALLRKDYDYVSALCTDSKGLEVAEHSTSDHRREKSSGSLGRVNNL